MSDLPAVSLRLAKVARAILWVHGQRCRVTYTVQLILPRRHLRYATAARTQVETLKLPCAGLPLQPAGSCCPYGQPDQILTSMLDCNCVLWQSGPAHCATQSDVLRWRGPCVLAR